MADNFLGYLVSIECKNAQFYQGVVSKIDLKQNTIQLSNYYQNGFKLSTSRSIDIPTNDVKNIEIIADSNRAKTFFSQNEVSQTRTKPTDAIRSLQQSQNYNNNNGSNGVNGYSHHYPNRHHQHQNDTCFSLVNTDNLMEGDFDFEKNLALFNKTESKLEFETGTTPIGHQNGSSIGVATSTSVTPTTAQQQQQRNYRFDEMVIDPGEPIKLNKQIEIPLELNKNIKRYYVTDDGYQIPCIHLELRQRLLAKSYSLGYTKSRQVECISKLCTEMAIQLLGGPIRFHPKNNHQKPNLCIFANNEIQGAYALCTARFLSIRNCNVYLYFQNKSSQSSQANSDDSDYGCVLTEYNLFRLSDAKQVQSIEDIENIPMDLVINGLDSTTQTDRSTNDPVYLNIVKYINKCKCNILSIDPPHNGSRIKSKWSIVPLLPLEMSEQCGRVYLCDLGFTRKLFDLFSIKYKSPFGAKFCIPLHEN